jgi:dTDP-4-dehydrorhamnose 3,5-epimerase
VIQELAIPGVWTYTPRRFVDSRGWFSETFNAQTLAEKLNGVTFVQDNQSCSRAAGTLRGMHFQIPPKAQDKLVRVLKGALLDVVVDLRNTSPTYGKWVSTVLSAENGVQLFAPRGFAHGFLTIEPDTEVLYKVSDYYSREHERGVAWDDPTIGVDWTISAGSVIMAERDRAFPRLADLPAFF